MGADALMVRRPFPGSRRCEMVSLPLPVQSRYHTALGETMLKQS